MFRVFFLVFFFFVYSYSECYVSQNQNAQTVLAYYSRYGNGCEGAPLTDCNWTNVSEESLCEFTVGDKLNNLWIASSEPQFVCGYRQESNCNNNWVYRKSYYCSRVLCSTEPERDSVICVRNSNLWINGACCDEQCVCENDGGHWQNGQCNPSCNDHVPVPDKCEEIFRNGYGMDGGYWAIQTFECYYDSCAMSLNCTEKSQFPAGNLTCDDFRDTTETPGRCVAVIGHTCTMQCPGNLTKTCDCDGNCTLAMTLPQCQCQSSSSRPPQSSSSGQNQSSASQSSSSGEIQSSDSQPPSPGFSSGSGPGDGDDWEYDYRGVLDSIKRNTGSTVGYLSSIDKRISSQNLLIQESTNRIVSASEAAAASAAAAIGETKDTFHNTNSILNGIDSRLGTLDSSVDVPDISNWQTSADSIINKLQHPDTAIVKVDSLNNDTSTFKTKYHDFFLSGVYTRNGCYEFVIKKPEANSMFGRFFSRDISLDFGSIVGFDFCAILRGICRIAGAVLVLLISIKSYRSAFSSEDG